MTNHMGRTSNKAAAIAVAIVVLLPIAYVLSTGPVVWLVAHDVVPGKSIETLYAPLGWTMDKSDLVKSVIHFYLSLWIGDLG
jgi:hypothetical protein